MTRRNRMLAALAIGPVWVRRVATPEAEFAIVTDNAEAAADIAEASADLDAAQVAATAQRPGDLDSSPTDAQIAAMDWDTLQRTVAVCTRCALCASRTRSVFGVGVQDAGWLIVGEGPGRNEDLQGEPFVGPAGKLLDNMLAAIDLRRGRNTFIANIVKCRPLDAGGKDRAPTVLEVAACKPYLQRQIALLKPSIVLALGKTAALALLEREPSTALSSLRGQVHRYGELPLVVTYHPAYLLRAPVDKRKSWEDLCLAVDTHDAGG